MLCLRYYYLSVCLFIFSHGVVSLFSTLSLTGIFCPSFLYQLKQECVLSTRMPNSHYHFLCLVDNEFGVKTLIWHLIYKDHNIGNMYTKFQDDWTLTSSKTTLIKNFNLNFAPSFLYVQ